MLDNPGSTSLKLVGVVSTTTSVSLLDMTRAVSPLWRPLPGYLATVPYLLSRKQLSQNGLLSPPQRVSSVPQLRPRSQVLRKFPRDSLVPFGPLGFGGLLPFLRFLLILLL